MPRYFAFNSGHFGTESYVCSSHSFVDETALQAAFGENARKIVVQTAMAGEAAEQRRFLCSFLLDNNSLPDGYSFQGEYTCVFNDQYLTDEEGIVRVGNPMEIINRLRIMPDGIYYGNIYWNAFSTPLIREHMPAAPEVIDAPVVRGTATTKIHDANSTWRTCGNCGRVDHDARTCEFPTKAHRLIGVELEGRWRHLNDVTRSARNAGLTACGDGSVHGSFSDCEPYEIQTKPANLGSTLQQVAEFYPDEADRSCGMHVHVSFQYPTDFSCLSSLEFFEYFKNRWEQWGAANNLSPDSEFYRRLRGRNNFCHINTIAPVQLWNIDRYHQLNFSAWSEHKTVECRMLPMFRTQQLAISAIKELIDIYETFLADPAAHGLRLPEANAEVEQALLPAQQLRAEVEIPALITEKLTRALEMSDPEPVTPGMIRIAIPGGKFNLAMLQKIANLQKKKAA